MKSAFYFIAFCMAFISFCPTTVKAQVADNACPETKHSVNFAKNDTARKKVAVVLSGGGAKGMAHIGVLRVIERAGIPIDIITGTSMGALIGGLYSIGYDAETLDSLVKVQDWKTLFSDKVNSREQNLDERRKQHTYLLSRPLNFSRKTRIASGGLISGTNLSRLFTKLTVGYHDSIDFSQLPIQFACVATNIVDNTEYDFHSGYLSTAMRASMAFPGVFTPVRKDSMVLVDGGLKNNYPADLAKQMGADIIIGVTVQAADKTADDLKSGPDVLLQIVDINCKNKLDENLAITDIPIKVNLDGYSSMSFTKTAIDSIIAKGEKAALESWDKIVALSRSLGTDNNTTSIYRKNSGVTSSDKIIIRIDSVSFEKINTTDRNYISSKYRLKNGSNVSLTQIEQAVATLGGTFLYTNVGYNLIKRPTGYGLLIHADEKRTSRINLGVRFDTEEMVALQANMSHNVHIGVPVTLEFTGRLGKRMMGRLDAEITPLHYGKTGFSYIFRHDDINIYNKGDRDYNFTYNQHTLNLQVIDFNIRNFSLDLNVKMDFYDFHDILSGASHKEESLGDVNLYSYIANMNYDSENRWFFATRGARFNAGYGYYTDNFIGKDGSAGISVAHFSWRMSFPLNNRFVIQPMVAGRFLAGRNIPIIMRNAIGGMTPGQYFEHQIPFAGIGYVEFVDNSILSYHIKGQQRIMDNNYIMARLSLAQHSEKVGELFKSGLMTGGEVAYFYDSMFGPIGASLGYSGYSKSPYFYINLGFQF